MKVFAVCDSKAGVYHSPFFQKTSTDALRGFEITVNNPETMLSKYAEDFSLCEFGEFSEKSGIFTLHAVPVVLAQASEVKKSSLDVPSLPFPNGSHPSPSVRMAADHR